MGSVIFISNEHPNSLKKDNNEEFVTMMFSKILKPYLWNSKSRIIVFAREYMVNTSQKRLLSLKYIVLNYKRFYLLSKAIIINHLFTYSSMIVLVSMGYWTLRYIVQ